MPHDILVAIIGKAHPADVKAAHRVCRAWHYAVRCGTTVLAPSAKHCSFPQLRACFPRVSPPCWPADSPTLRCHACATGMLAWMPLGLPTCASLSPVC
jgi:hypothetical protein